jgi:hypothetical protein
MEHPPLREEVHLKVNTPNFSYFFLECPALAGSKQDYIFYSEEVCLKVNAPKSFNASGIGIPETRMRVELKLNSYFNSTNFLVSVKSPTLNW